MMSGLHEIIACHELSLPLSLPNTMTTSASSALTGLASENLMKGAQL
jgi:hypothetical protein